MSEDSALEGTVKSLNAMYTFLHPESMTDEKARAIVESAEHADKIGEDEARRVSEAKKVLRVERKARMIDADDLVEEIYSLENEFGSVSKENRGWTHCRQRILGVIIRMAKGE